MSRCKEFAVRCRRASQLTPRPPLIERGVVYEDPTCPARDVPILRKPDLCNAPPFRTNLEPRQQIALFVAREWCAAGDGADEEVEAHKTSQSAVNEGEHVRRWFAAGGHGA